VTGSPYGINFETSGSSLPVSINDLIQYQANFGVQYEQILDAETRVFNLYGRGASFPTYYVIDRKGIVRFSTSTAISRKNLAKEVQAAL
jgi:hypothetical protein